jgi:signal transduction histidine kinase
VHDNLVPHRAGPDATDGPGAADGSGAADAVDAALGAVDADRLLALEHAVADLVATGESADLLLTGLLAAIGTMLGWVFGAAWLPDDVADRLRCAAVWHDGSPALAGFAATTEALTLSTGIGLPGRVWQSGKPDWLADVRLDPNFPRAQAARDAGLAAAMCFPVISREGTEALVEFFTTAPLEPRGPLLATVASMGRRVGDALHRHRDEETVRRSEAGFERYLHSQQPTILDQRVVTTGMRADGREFPVELTITRVAVPGVPVFAAYLRDLTDSRAAEAELRASRLRVVDAGIRERQRLERDLHDGAQQQLISLGLILARARATVPDNPTRTAGLLDDAVVRLEDAAQELRDLARGINPSSLTRYGLGAACTDLVRRGPVTVDLQVTAPDRYPPVVEANAYFVISEALTNVARYAPGAQARVTVTATGNWLSVTVVDDGPGGADPARGTGLRGLADRLALLDGALEVDSPVGHGTTLRARIPLPANA